MITTAHKAVTTTTIAVAIKISRRPEILRAIPVPPHHGRSAHRRRVRQALARPLDVPPAFRVAVEIRFPVHADFFPLPLVGPKDHEIGMPRQRPRPLGLDGPRPRLA